MSVFVADKLFDKIDFLKKKIEVTTYEDCTFIDCSFYEINLSSFNFIGCIFKNCDLSNAKLGNTAFRDVTFENCKMLGLCFEHCNQLMFSVSIKNCQLDLCSFYQVSLKTSSFESCRLKDVDFTEADLKGIRIGNSDFTGAIFDHTNLEKTDLRQSYNFSINPEINNIKRAKVSASEIIGFLHQYNLEIK